ncbi:hypothetical protein ACWDBW_15460 [Streptomyces sp. NPDC001107]
MHDVVSRKLGNDPALQRLAEEAASGRESLSDRTQQRVLLALEEAGETDTGFATDFEQAMDHLQSVAPVPGLQSGGDHIVVHHNTFHGPVQAKGIQHIHRGAAS